FAARAAGSGFGPGKCHPRPFGQTCCTVRRRGWAVARSGASSGAGPNKSFKPNPLRYAKHMAGTACHVFRFTTLLGLTLVLGARCCNEPAVVRSVEAPCGAPHT